MSEIGKGAEPTLESAAPPAYLGLIPVTGLQVIRVGFVLQDDDDHNLTPFYVLEAPRDWPLPNRGDLVRFDFLDDDPGFYRVHDIVFNYYSSKTGDWHTHYHSFVSISKWVC